MQSFTTLAAAATLAAVAVPSAVSAGEFTPTVTLGGEVALEYTGEVLFGDDRKMAEAVALWDIDLILINSPGGYAYAGVELNEAARELGVRTMAGDAFGAWSAGALFWIGGTAEFESATAPSGFHYAYVPGRPDIKTDTVNAVMAIAMRDSGLTASNVEYLLNMMDRVREQWGWAGFVVFTVDGIDLIDVTAPSSPATEENIEELETIKNPQRRSEDSLVPLNAPVMEQKESCCNG